MTALSATGTTSSLQGRISIEALDHLVLIVRDLDATLAFYVDVLGMRHEHPGDGRDALHFGDQKLNLHVAGRELPLRAGAATPGSADLCLLTRTPVEGVVRVLEAAGVEVVEGPVERTGATGPLLSVYVRDPDGNLVEISNALAD